MTTPQIPSGWHPCPATTTPADRGAAVWSRRITERTVWGLDIQQQYGVTGGILRAAVALTVREARGEHCCQGGCGHLIRPGQMYGASLAGGVHYCSCCVTADEPESQFTTKAA